MDDNTDTPITSKKSSKPSKSGKSEVIINPKIDDQNLRPVNERVINMMQRVRRGAMMRRRESILKLKKAIARMHPHSKKQLAAKSKAIAKDVVRARFAGKRGTSYHTMSIADKIQVDRQIDPKTKLIHRIAARLMPRLRAADVRRLAAVVSKKGVKGIRSYMGNNLISASVDYGTAEQIYERASLATRLADRVAVKLAEGGPFGDPKQKPRKGSVAWHNAQRQKRNPAPPIEPRDQQVGNAKILPKE